MHLSSGEEEKCWVGSKKIDDLSSHATESVEASEVGGNIGPFAQSKSSQLSNKPYRKHHLFGGNFTGAKLCSSCGSFDVVWWYMVIHVGVLIYLWLWCYMLYTYKKYSDDICWFSDLGWYGFIW
jgi:hypothetical protein